MFACIFIPNFSVAAIVRAEPELHAQAIAIFDGKPPLEKLFAVSDKAVGMGVALGMTKAQAELCPELILRQRSPLQESAAHAALLDCAQSFSPCVEDAAADAAILDLTGMETLFGSPKEIAQSLFSRAAQSGLDGNVAIAANPDAAMLAAHGFSGMTVIPGGREAIHLGSLPLEVLIAVGPGSKKEEIRKEWGSPKEKSKEEKTEDFLQTLHRWGVRDLRALAALPAIALSERLGQEGLLLQQLARGAASRTLVPVEEPAAFEETVELDFPILLLEPLAFLLNRLLDQICARLTSRALATQELRLTLELENFSQTNRPQQFCRTLRLPLPMLDAKLFLKLLQLDLNANPPGAPILKIHLAAEPARQRSSQGGLFLPPSPEPEKLELTLARIAGLVGESHMGSIELLDTNRAEGFRMRRFAPGSSAKKNLEKNPANDKSCAKESPVAALRMFRPPLRAVVTLEYGEPVHVVCKKKKEVQGAVLWKAGPWRSSGDWWEREAWSRDEWDIALQTLENVALYRLVHDLLGGSWYVEGAYD